LLTPTALHHYTVDELENDEKRGAVANGAKNSNLGRFTNYMNLLDCCAVAVPSGVLSLAAKSGPAPAAVAGVDHAVALLGPGTNPEEVARAAAIAQRPATLPWGVTLVAEAWGDWMLLDIAEAWARDSNLKRGPAGHHVSQK
jgi:allophanate hydrolase